MKKNGVIRPTAIIDLPASHKVPSPKKVCPSRFAVSPDTTEPAIIKIPTVAMMIVKMF